MLETIDRHDHVLRFDWGDVAERTAVADVLNKIVGNLSKSTGDIGLARAFDPRSGFRFAERSFSTGARSGLGSTGPVCCVARFARCCVPVIIGGFHVSGCLSMLDGRAVELASASPCAARAGQLCVAWPDVDPDGRADAGRR